jgi:ornithine lipid hydroxylase
MQNTSALHVDAEEPSWRRLAKALVFPLVLGTALGGALLALEAGLPPPAVLGVVSMAAWIIIALVERWLPFRPDWNHSQGDILTDLLHNLLSSYATIEVVKLMLVMALLPLAGWASATWGSPLWPSQWPLLAQLALAAVLIEFGCYWIHRASHELDALWRFHAVHHSPGRLYWFNAGRDHPVGAALTTLASLPVAIVLGVPLECMTLYFVLQSVHGLFQHANIDVRLGPLNWVFSMAELHRWHHSRRIEEANNNYGLTLIVWDIVFGTRYFPGRHGPASIGVDSATPIPQGYLAQMAVPFRWHRYRQP